jgi:predicted RNA methylase
MAVVRSLTSPIVVPANSSRFLPRHEAVRQPTGVVELAWDDQNPWLFNQAFDPSLILYDSAYYTTVVDLDRRVQVPTLNYFADDVLPHLPPNPHVVDIGCGQGEFVRGVQAIGVRATGYDPVVRKPDDTLHARYWTTCEGPADAFVLRCVLPHLRDPWAFLDAIGQLNANALVLVEFQRLDWILDHGIWYQISHDHVNLFTEADLADRYHVEDAGTFGADEWAWMLIQPSRRRTVAPKPFPSESRLETLLSLRAATLQAVEGATVAIWGAAGKGIVLGHALLGAGANVVAAIDADPGRQGLFLEVSGLEVLSPAGAVSSLPKDTTVLVCNPNHLDDVVRAVHGRWRVCLPSDLA